MSNLSEKIIDCTKLNNASQLIDDIISVTLVDEMSINDLVNTMHFLFRLNNYNLEFLDDFMESAYESMQERGYDSAAIRQSVELGYTI